MKGILTKKKYIISSILILILISGFFGYSAKKVQEAKAQAAGNAAAANPTAGNSAATAEPQNVQKGLGERMIGDNILRLLGVVVQFFVWIGGYILSACLYIFFWVARYNNFIESPAVTTGWYILRDLCNICFVAIFLVMTVATVLGIESYAYTRILTKLLIMVVLINFSKLICGIFIDASQFVMLTFMKSFGQLGTAYLTHMLGLDVLMDAITSQADNYATTWGILGSYVLVLAYVVVAIAVILVLILVLIQRIVMLWIYVVLSPIAYLASTFPGGSGYANKWWSEFTKYLTIGPIVAFFVWLSFVSLGNVENQNKIINKDGLDVGAPQVGITQAGTPSHILKFMIGIALLLGGLMTAQTAGGIAGKFAGNMTQWVQNRGMQFSGARRISETWGAFSSRLESERKRKVAERGGKWHQRWELTKGGGKGVWRAGRVVSKKVRTGAVGALLPKKENESVLRKGAREGFVRTAGEWWRDKGPFFLSSSKVRDRIEDNSKLNEARIALDAGREHFEFNDTKGLKHIYTRVGDSIEHNQFDQYNKDFKGDLEAKRRVTQRIEELQTPPDSSLPEEEQNRIAAEHQRIIDEGFEESYKGKDGRIHKYKFQGGELTKSVQEIDGSEKIENKNETNSELMNVKDLNVSGWDRFKHQIWGSWDKEMSAHRAAKKVLKNEEISHKLDQFTNAGLGSEALRVVFQSNVSSKLDKIAAALRLAQKGAFKTQSEIKLAKNYISDNNVIKGVFDSAINKEQAWLHYQKDDGTFKEGQLIGGAESGKFDLLNQKDAFSNGEYIKLLKKYYDKDFRDVLKSKSKQLSSFEQENLATGLVGNFGKEINDFSKDMRYAFAAITGDLKRAFTVNKWDTERRQFLDETELHESAIRDYAKQAKGLELVETDEKILKENPTILSNLAIGISLSNYKSLDKSNRKPELVSLIRSEIERLGNVPDEEIDARYAEKEERNKAKEMRQKLKEKFASIDRYNKEIVVDESGVMLI